MKPYSTPLGPAIDLTHESRAEAVSGKVSVGLGWHIVKVNHGQLFTHDGGTGGYRAFAGSRTDT